MKQRVGKSILRILPPAGIVLLLFFWLFSELKLLKVVTPPPGATNLWAHMNSNAEIQRIRIFERYGSNFCEVIMKVPAVGLALPSGPPSYIYNESGMLVDWIMDRDEPPASFVRKWGDLRNGEFLTVEEAKLTLIARKSFSSD